MRVAALQFRGRHEDLPSRRRALARWIWGAGPDVDVVVCPELAVGGYFFTSYEHARTVSEPSAGPTFHTVSPVARALRAWVVCGFVERDRDRLFNSALVIRPDGSLAFVYRKTLLFEADEIWACPGDSGYARFDTEHGDFSVGICMDLNDDRFIAWLRSRAPRALAFPTRWIDEGIDTWPYWAGRLEGVRCALVAANGWGREATSGFSGRSAIMEPEGAARGRWKVLAAAEATGDRLLQATLAP